MPNPTQSAIRPLAYYVQVEREREAVRRSYYERDLERCRGVSWGGMAPEPFKPRTEEQLVARAKEFRDALIAREWVSSHQSRIAADAERAA